MRTMRPRARQTMTESELQIAVMQHLRLRAWPDVVYWHTPNGGARSKAQAGRFKAEGVVAGVPDIQIISRGRAVFLELKTERGRLSPAQEAMHRRLKEAGAKVETAYGLDDALAILTSYGVFRRPGESPGEASGEAAAP